MKPGKELSLTATQDGTPEAYTLLMLRGSTFRSVAPEYCASQDPVSKPLFEAFGGNS